MDQNSSELWDGRSQLSVYLVVVVVVVFISATSNNGTVMYNTLTASLHLEDNYTRFKRLLKAFVWSRLQRAATFCFSASCINFLTYLLTSKYVKLSVVQLCGCSAAYYQAPPGPTVVVNPVPMTGTASIFPPDPIQTTCPNCHQSILTQISYELGALVWIAVIILLIIGFVLFAVAPEVVWQVWRPPYQSEIWYGGAIPMRWHLGSWFSRKSLNLLPPDVRF